MAKKTSKAEITSTFAQHVSSGKVEFFQSAGIDFVMGRREGIYMEDIDGAQLINCHSNGGVFNLGHRHPLVIEVLRSALDDLDIGNHHLVSELRATLGARIAELSPGDLNRVIFGVSGGEAVDMAIKLARAHTGRPKIISADGGYHGHTGLALAAGEEMYRASFGPLAEGFIQIPFNDLEALEAAMGDDTAAVLFETIPATLGIIVPDEDFYKGVRRLCDQHGALFILDEVQTGLGRCGELWGFETFDVVPDIFVTGKGLSGGIYPMSATVYRDELNAFPHEHPFVHISTFGGSEVGCTTALTVLQITAEPDFLQHVKDIANVFAAGFDKLRADHPAVVDSGRQRGMMMGLKLTREDLGPIMSVFGFQHGIFTVYANHDPSVLQMLPPLIVTHQEADQILNRLDGMLTSVGALVESASTSD